MKQTAQVVIRDGKTFARIERSEACMQCHACEYGQHEESFIELTGKHYHEGDTVEIELERGRLTAASIIAYGIPLAGLLLGLAIGSFLHVRELWQAAAGLIGTGIGFLVLKLLEPKFGNFRPHISTSNVKK